MKIGVTFPQIEFGNDALNQDFTTRGRRVEEQVDLLRRLWTQPLVEYTGRWHTIPDAGINLPTICAPCAPSPKPWS